jgi:hypothetical protein
MVIIKLDFEKDFDKIEHKVILQVLNHKGFGLKWQNWIKMIMESETSSILLMKFQGKYSLQVDSPIATQLCVVICKKSVARNSSNTRDKCCYR